MRLWSKGLGKSNLGIDFSKVRVQTLDNALNQMPSQAAELLSKELSTDKLVVFSGKISPPTGWQFVILFERKDLFSILFKLFRSKHTIKLIFGDAEAKERIKAGVKDESDEDTMET